MQAKRTRLNPEDIAPEIRRAIEATAREGRLACAEAHRLAEELKVSPLVVGQAADALGIKLVSCQLGCF
ncbi:MAG: hypothetical protein QHH27_00765 [Clostridia bacterium]|jgi:hypothetical protein|nr:hypothetical protein [Clostridia bacterium]MDH7572079.1 hypothetical protein [Clostridia bacterium]